MPKKQTEWRFIVKGTGRFPIDMLRYDGAFPASSSDAVLIASAVKGGARRGNEFKITLISKSHAPTSARWQSFGWFVENV